MLRQHHIFIGLSYNEPCSNAIIEAMHCGLPVLIRNSGGNSEFAQDGATLYSEDSQLLNLIDRMCGNYIELRLALNPKQITDIAQGYLRFFDRLLGKGYSKEYSKLDYFFFRKRYRSVISYSFKKVLRELL